MKTLRTTQRKKATESHLVLSSLGCVYIAGQVRSGKTATSLEVGRLGGYKNILFLTKKKAISSIKEDYTDFGFNNFYELTVVNDESMHKIDNVHQFDLIIHDEHHRFGSFPKPGKYTKMYRELFFMKPMIFLSGTPTPESYSQMFHQFWVTNKGPWSSYRNFYAWASDGYVNKMQQHIGSHIITKYDRADKSMVMNDVRKYMVTMTQAESGFKSTVEESFMHVKMNTATRSMCKTLLDDLVIEGKSEVILGDTPAKLQQKLHQMWSGTIKFESGNSMVLDYSKVDAIIDRFKDNKIAIFYKFKAEFKALKDRLGDRLTDSVSEFDECEHKWIALQVVSGREGVNLSSADYLVMYNIDFSATSYWQARDRMTVKDRTKNEVVWVFSSGGIEDKIYKAVSKKKNYTSSIFKKDYNIK